MELPVREIVPYGDSRGDGVVQLSFTLPVPAGPLALEAAKRVAAAMSLEETQIVHHQGIDRDYTFFVVYGKLKKPVALPAQVATGPENEEALGFDAINAFIRERIRRKVVVIGACTGSDAHTVGIDAIMNMKGHRGEYGLERYPEFEAYNLGSQVSNEALLAKAKEKHADALLVSQIVTQKDAHLKNLTALVDMAEAEGVRDRLILICGGPRITHELALELGFDAGFGAGTLPNEVATFIVRELERRMKNTKP